VSLNVLIDEATIQSRVKELAKEINAKWAGKPLVVIVVLKGSFIFAADLVRHLEGPIEIDFLGLSSYGHQTKSSGIVQITHDLNNSIEGKHVLLIEDIVDTGLTMDYLYRNLRTRKPASIELAVLLYKPARKQVAVSIDYLGFTIEDRFVVGYGLDYQGRHRHIPYLAELQESTSP